MTKKKGKTLGKKSMKKTRGGITFGGFAGGVRVAAGDVNGAVNGGTLTNTQISGNMLGGPDTSPALKQ